MMGRAPLYSPPGQGVHISKYSGGKNGFTQEGPSLVVIVLALAAVLMARGSAAPYHEGQTFAPASQQEDPTPTPMPTKCYTVRADNEAGSKGIYGPLPTPLPERFAGLDPSLTELVVAEERKQEERQSPEGADAAPAESILVRGNVEDQAALDRVRVWCERNQVPCEFTPGGLSFGAGPP